LIESVPWVLKFTLGCPPLAVADRWGNHPATVFSEV